MITVLGASGFIGSHLVRYLAETGSDFQAIGRDERPASTALGHVIYCIGLTADFRERPYDTVEAHVSALARFIRESSYDSLLYLSSTRVYRGMSGVAREEDDLLVAPSHAEDLYSISKIMGESIVLSLGNGGRVARLSGIYGTGQVNTFLASILADARRHAAITFESAPQSQRDFLSVQVAVRVLVEIALRGRHRIYNVASGMNVTNAELAAAIAKGAECDVSFAPDAPALVFPTIDIERIRREFAFAPSDLMTDLPALIEARS